MRLRSLTSLAVLPALVAALVAVSPGSAGVGPHAVGRDKLRVPDGGARSTPAILSTNGLSRYFVVMKAAGLATAVKRGGPMSPAQQESAVASALRSQDAAIRQVRSLGGRVFFRYARTVNAFSARLTPSAVKAIAARSDVASVQPVGIVKAHQVNNSTKFIGAPEVWRSGFMGEGMRVALVDTGIDYTHADFGGSGDPAEYENNDPAIIEPGTFPTPKVIGGFDFVGQDYNVLDDDPSNDDPIPDPDPLDADGHGTHTGGTCCGIGVPGIIQPGVAPKAKLYAVKVWDEGNSTDDVLVAGYEFAVDPDQNGNTNDKADVLSFSGGVSYGTKNSVEAQAAQGVVDLGTVFVASAGNSGHQASGGSAYIGGTPSTAPGVISVAASLVAFLATTLDVNSPPGVVLPDNGITVIQSWGGGLAADLTTNLYDAREVDPPADPANPTPADALVCDPLPPGSLAGRFALIFKGSTGAGDCDGSLKALNAQDAGATGVLFWNGFGGLPFGLGSGCCGGDVTVPVIMASGDDSEVLGDTLSPNASSGQFNDVTVNVTFHADVEPVPGFEDSMASFTSEGPARLTSDLKPDISAPGVDIVSAGVGLGTGEAVLSGTSMAAPHVSGSAVLIRQIHPTWTPAQVKAVLMNQATLEMKNNDLTAPVSATVMGAGRVRVDQSAAAVSVAMPGSLSFRLQPRAVMTTLHKSFAVKNFDSIPHTYSLSGGVRYSDFGGAVASVVATPASFSLAPGGTQAVDVALTLDPDQIEEAEQEFGWYYIHPNIDGVVQISQSGGSSDSLHVTWHVAPLAASRNSLSATSLDLTSGSATMTANHPASAGVDHADLYLLGAFSDTLPPSDPALAEADISAIGARSFTGSSIDGVAEGVPAGTDEFAGIMWQDFLTFSGYPTEPVEFGVQFYGVHNTTETLEVDVLVDAGADGVFADPGLMADYMIVKEAARGGTVCVFDLSLADPFADCAVTYFPDYTNYNGNILGIVVDAAAIGLSDSAPELAYQVTACTGRFSGDVPAPYCDTAGGFDGTTYTARLNTTDPALNITPLVCGGFWDGGACGAANPITVSVGSAQPGDNPSILALFPNNAPSPNPTIVRTTT